MASNFGLGGSFLAALAADGITDGELKRIANRGLTIHVVNAIKQVIEDDRERERQQHAERMRVYNTLVPHIREASGVTYDDPERSFSNMIAILKDNGIERIGRLAASNRTALHEMGLTPWQTNYLSVALDTLGMPFERPLE